MWTICVAAWLAFLPSKLFSCAESYVLLRERKLVRLILCVVTYTELCYFAYRLLLYDILFCLRKCYYGPYPPWCKKEGGIGQNNEFDREEGWLHICVCLCTIQYEIAFNQCMVLCREDSKSWVKLSHQQRANPVSANMHERERERGCLYVWVWCAIRESTLKARERERERGYRRSFAKWQNSVFIPSCWTVWGKTAPRICSNKLLFTISKLTAASTSTIVREKSRWFILLWIPSEL